MRYFKKSFFLSLLFVQILLMLGCSEKFEDDPFIVLGPPFERITGKRKLVEFTANSRDTLSHFTKIWGDFYVDFTGTNYYNQPLLFIRNAANGKEISAGNYRLIGGQKIFLQFWKKDPFQGYSRIFEIRKCTRKELIIESDSSEFSEGDTSNQLYNLKMIFKKHVQ